MHQDVQDLRNFYYRSALGRAAQKVVRAQLMHMWPEAKGLSVCGYGFALPILRPYLRDARRVVALMPGPQGVMPWPAGMPNVSVLCEEVMWPLETGHVDRLVLMHGLETSDHAALLLDEAARVLGPGGKLMVIVPNRAGLWSRSEKTPFGHGRPYSSGQLESLLGRHGFITEQHATVLYQPPSQRRFWLRMGGVMEKAGRALPVLAGGVLMVEAAKRVQAPTGPGERIRARPLRVLEGLSPEPKPKPV
ncbi:methyltransferase domain-containing protein [Mesobacterium pallidum]|uniref:methyltransferase domain-containing protein n=1 Tax=Mesobacterium pallidum TaxID=2872037 RepID=UPI001EE2342C|nr:methyltransferase domain-containing protein [Mesobacterium pallidum]